jgi:hypothetical protein
MKAILELEMPRCCMECPLYYKRIAYVDTHFMCAALNKEIGYSEKAYDQRYSGCPLKPKDEEA